VLLAYLCALPPLVVTATYACGWVSVYQLELPIFTGLAPGENGSQASPQPRPRNLKRTKRAAGMTHVSGQADHPGSSITHGHGSCAPQNPVNDWPVEVLHILEPNTQLSDPYAVQNLKPKTQLSDPHPQLGM
jgi:hypothetical protein